MEILKHILLFLLQLQLPVGWVISVSVSTSLCCDFVQVGETTSNGTRLLLGDQKRTSNGRPYEFGRVGLNIRKTV